MVDLLKHITMICICALYTIMGYYACDIYPDQAYGVGWCVGVLAFGTWGIITTLIGD